MGGDSGIVTLSLLYFRPDYPLLLQQFVWQTVDLIPRLPRVHRFLIHWKTSIRVPIREAVVSWSDVSDIRSADITMMLH